MRTFDRRGFLRLAGAAGAVAPLATALGRPAPVTGQLSGAFTFRAVAGLPALPLPAYASFVLTGHVDAGSRSGMLTQTVFAGAPGAMSAIAFPGLSRSVRVTGVQQAGGVLELTGVVDDRSQLQPGESPLVQVTIDRSAGTVRAPVFGSSTLLDLEA